MWKYGFQLLTQPFLSNPDNNKFKKTVHKFRIPLVVSILSNIWVLGMLRLFCIIGPNILIVHDPSKVWSKNLNLHNKDFNLFTTDIKHEKCPK